MNQIEIIVGSMLGATEEVAEQIAELAQQQGFSCNVHFQPNLDQLSKSAFWLICSSTHGAGDLPDNIQPFGTQLKQASDLNQLSFAVIALGDTSYDTYCQAGKTLYSDMLTAGATAISEPFCINVLEHGLPEEPAVAWFQDQLETIREL